jgi:hypothetical protein
MENKQAELREMYETMTTDELRQLHAAGTLTDDAYAVLESVLVSRSMPVPARPNRHAQAKTGKRGAHWVTRFAVIGILLPIICLTLDFKPAVVLRACELCWPSGFLLLAMDGHFNPLIVLVSIVINALIWAGFGWLIGYALSDRTK